MISFRSLRPIGLATAVLGLATLAAACGGDGDDSGSPVASGTGSDDAYVASMCTAYDDFADTFAKLLNDRITADPGKSPQTQKEAMQIYIEPFEKLVAGMEDANPPKDVQRYHADMVKTLKSTLKKANDGDVNAFGALANPRLPELPSDVKARLNEATRANNDCRAASFSFD